MNRFVVAIDGPAGSGKSSISKKVAKQKGFTHLDTGAMYRAVTLEALRRNIDLNDESKYDFLNQIELVYKEGKIFLNGEDVSKEIRSELVTNYVSTPSKLKVVRDKMVEFQKKSAQQGYIVMDGRDIGTIVVPDAELKIFLTASAEERAKRRCIENAQTGIESDYETILKEIQMRDYKDSHREIAPLKKAEDAILIDTTNMTIEEVCNTIIKLIDKRFNEMENFTMDNLDMPKELKVGDVVEGTVVSIDDKTIYLDIHNFTEGMMHLDHYTKDKSVESFNDLVHKGDKIKCQVAKIDEEHIYLSRLNQISEENFKEVIQAKEENQNLLAHVQSEIKDKGYLLNYKGNTLFLPKSQSTSEVVVGKNIEVRILEIEEKRKRAVVSRRVIEQEIYQENRAKELDSIAVNDVLKGKVAKVEKYGAIVRFNYVQGLLKTNQVSHSFIDIEKELHVGDEIEVKVISKENNKLVLSRKALLKTPFALYIEQHKVSDKVVGKVVNKLGFGLLLELADNVKGLLHSSEYSHNPNDNFNNHVKIGDMVEVAIIGIQEEKEKISLSRKALMDNPWSRVTAKEGDLVDIKVSEVKENGLVVETLGVDGFVPEAEALAEKKDNLASYYAVGDTTKAYITEIKPKEWRLILSIRKYLAEEDRKSYEKYLNEEDATVTIGERFKEVLK